MKNNKETIDNKDNKELPELHMMTLSFIKEHCLEHREYFENIVCDAIGTLEDGQQLHDVVILPVTDNEWQLYVAITNEIRDDQYEGDRYEYIQSRVQLVNDDNDDRRVTGCKWYDSTADEFQTAVDIAKVFEQKLKQQLSAQ